MVDPELWACAECLFAQRTLGFGFCIPETFDAVQAEVVSTGDGGGVGVDFQTDATLELLLERHGEGHVCDWRE